jgi:hypothetical protein
MISAKVDCVDVNDFFSSSNSKDFRFSPNPFSLGMLVTFWGYGCSFFLCIGLGFLVEFVIGALGEFLVMGFVFFWLYSALFSVGFRLFGVSWGWVEYLRFSLQRNFSASFDLVV